MRVPLGQLTKATSIERKPNVLKKPALKDRADKRSPKNKNVSQSSIFMQKAYSWGQTYVCPGLTLSRPGFQKLTQAGGGGIRSPSPELNQILYGQTQSYEKCLCKLLSVLVRKWRHNDAINFFSLQYMSTLMFRHCDIKMTSYIKIFYEFEFRA